MVVLAPALKCALCTAAALQPPAVASLHLGRRHLNLLRMEASSPLAKSGDDQTVEVPEDQRDLSWFYGAVDEEKQFSDYTWDPKHPGSFKPGLTPENYSMEDVMEMWKDKPNDNVMRFTLDEVHIARTSRGCCQASAAIDAFIHIPLKPPEGILEWLERKGLLSEEDDETIDDFSAEDAGMLDEEFDLEESDEDTVTDASMLDPKDMGATMSDFM
eukprot:scaffold8183_cov122-Isochrysis_galbana.AAC.6